MDFIPFLFEKFSVFKDRLISVAGFFMGEPFAPDESGRLRPEIDLGFSVAFDDVDMGGLMVIGINYETQAKGPQDSRHVNNPSS
jgi:hypothetical protein